MTIGHCSNHDGCFNSLIDKQFLKHLKGRSNSPWFSRWWKVKFKSKSWKECVPNQTRATESVIPIKKENKQVKESDLLRKISKGKPSWTQVVWENYWPVKVKTGSHSGNRAKLCLSKKQCFWAMDDGDEDDGDMNGEGGDWWPWRGS